MDGIQDPVTLDEFKLFHRIDRAVYIILVRDLCRNPSECLQIMGLWLLLERGGFCNIISKILSLPPFMINELADEAVTCLKCINNQFSSSSEAAAEITFTQSLVKKDLSLQYFHQNRLTAFHEIQVLVSDICIPALSDLMEIARHGGFGESSTQSQTRAPSSSVDSVVQNFSNLTVGGEDASPSRGRARSNETYDRTMFATFSKGYPVSEREVRQFFTRVLGNCIESLHMQEVRPDEQALYARIIFLSPAFIQIILNGENKAKFNINGKHVWIRQFVPRNGRTLPCGCPNVGPSTCPHHQ